MFQCYSLNCQSVLRPCPSKRLMEKYCKFELFDDVLTIFCRKISNFAAQDAEHNIKGRHSAIKQRKSNQKAR